MLYYCTTQGKYYTTSNGERRMLQELTGRYQIAAMLEDYTPYVLLWTCYTTCLCQFAVAVELKFAITEQQKSVLTGNRLL